MSRSRTVRTLVSAATWATLAAGAFGAARQRAEARARLAGRLPALGPVGEAAPTGGTGDTGRTGGPGGVAERVAAWIPDAPRTRPGRLLAAVWAAPLTTVGFMVALASGSVPRWDADRRCFIATGVGGASGFALGAVGAAANTIGTVVLSRTPAPSSALLDHEAVHARQAERLGPLLPVAYAWLGARYGYAANPLERAARGGAARTERLRAAGGGDPAAR